jgi:hypothetical protein
MQYDPHNLRAQDQRNQDKANGQRIEREQELADFAELMALPAGRRFMWRVLDKCGVYRSSFRTSSEMGFLEGQRNIGLMLLHELHETCPERYIEMITEAKERHK